MGKKSQVWLVDLLIGLSIFVVAVSFYYKYASEQLEGSSSINDIMDDGDIITSSLNSPGIPSNWSNETVIRLGVTDNKNNIDEAKLKRLLNLSYPRLKSVLNAKSDFFVFIKDSSGCLIELDSNIYGFGHSGVILSEGEGDDDGGGEGGGDSEGNNACTVENAKNMTIGMNQVNPKKLAKIERLVIYNSKINKMVAYVWE